MIIMKNNKIKTVINCPLRYNARIAYDKKDNQIKVYPCCSYEFTTHNNKPLTILTEDDLINNRVFDKILAARSDKNNYRDDVDFMCQQITSVSIENKFCDWFHMQLRSVEVGLQQTCNLHCKMCRYDHAPNKKIDDLYFLVLNSLKGHNLEMISFTQEGEPFFYKSKMMDYLKSLKYDEDCKILHIISNLTMLNDNDIDDLIEIQKKGFVFYFTASIDGITRTTYQNIRQNVLFDKVMHNALRLCESNILSTVNFVITLENISELLEAQNYWLSKNVNFCGLIVDNALSPEGKEILNRIEYKEYLKNTKPI